MSPTEVAQFERVDAAPGTVLLRITARSPPMAPSGPPTLVIRNGEHVHRLRPVPAPTARDGPLRVAFAAPLRVLDRDVLAFALEFPGGPVIDLPAPTRRALRRETEARAEARRRAIVELERRLAAERDRRADAERRADALARAHSEATAALAALEAESSRRLEAERAQAGEEVERARAELAETHRRAGVESEARTAAERAVEALRDELRDLSREKRGSEARLAAVLEARQAAEARAADAEQRADASARAHLESTAALAALEAEHREALRARSQSEDELREELERVRAELAETDRRVRVESEERAAAERAVDVLRIELRDLSEARGVAGARVAQAAPAVEFEQVAPEEPPVARPRSAATFAYLAIGGAAVVLGVVLLVTAGHGNDARAPAGRPAPVRAAVPVLTNRATPPPAASHTLLELVLLPAGRNRNADGTALIVRRGQRRMLELQAKGLIPNGGNSYAVWLVNPGASRMLGFLPAVGSDGRFAGWTSLPVDAARFHTLLVTLEASASPTRPGQPVLRAHFP